MSVAERTRQAVRDRPFLQTALSAGVVNYSAAARWLPVEGDEESIATALRRYAAELDAPDREDRPVSVRLDRRLEQVEGLSDTEADERDGAAIVVSGDVGASALERVLGRLRTADIDVEAARVTSEALTVVVPRRAGADALRIAEDELDAP